ncbi:MAG: ABC transporter permease [Candidatus Bathyarchaeota archaeon]|nr:ABC transporter permease [Candidatus Bathyarchaeota archaeon]
MSSGAGFPVNDLLRRRYQTGLVTATLTLSVASTLFLLLFSSRIGVGLAASTNAYTMGLTSVFSQFILFIGVLVFVVGAILTSFSVYVMMAQRTRDFGLIKAAGCPNSLIGGYFLTELLTVTTLACGLGVAFGFIADFAASSTVLGSYTLGNWWYAPIVAVAFFVLALFFGLQPMLKAAKMTAIEALSPISYYGSTVTGASKALSHSALTWRIAQRSMARRLSPIARLVFLLSIVFVLLTVSVAGGIIAKDTTTSWMSRSVDADAIAIAHPDLAEQYQLLLSKFVGAQEKGNFDYSNPDYGVPQALVEKLKALPTVDSLDRRLVRYEHIREISNFTVIDGKEASVGGRREADVLVIGVDPLQSAVAVKGRDLEEGAFEAVIGDSLSLTMYVPDRRHQINLSDPLVESLGFADVPFRIVGVCVDPINNGLVAYVPIDKMLNATETSDPNLLIIDLNGTVNREAAIAEIRSIVKQADSDLDVFDLQGVMNQNQAFLGGTWQTIMLLPLLSLASAALCLVSYMMLSVNEQRAEFGMLRAVGAKPRLIIHTCAIQSGLVLLSSFGVGLSFGVIATVLILMENPLITTATLLAIAFYLGSALAAMFLFSIYPAFKLAKSGILNIMA